MGESIAVIPPPFNNSASLKRLALMFDRVCVHHLDMISSPPRGMESTTAFLASQARYLIENGIAFEPPKTSFEGLILDYSGKKDRIKISYPGIPPMIIKFKYKKKADRMDAILNAFVRSHGHLEDQLTRIYSCELRSEYGMETYPIVKGALRSAEGFDKQKSDILTIVIGALPEPSDSVPWDQILDYRNDPDSRCKFLALRNWMIDMAHANYSPVELTQKLEYLIDQYEQHLKLHRMKTNARSLETILVAGAEFVENLTRLRFSRIAKGLFTIRHQRIALHEAELTVPGREVAYIAKARESFSSD